MEKLNVKVCGITRDGSPVLIGCCVDGWRALLDCIKAEALEWMGLGLWSCPGLCFVLDSLAWAPHLSAGIASQNSSGASEHKRGNFIKGAAEAS